MKETILMDVIKAMMKTWERIEQEVKYQRELKLQLKLLLASDDSGQLADSSPRKPKTKK